MSDSIREQILTAFGDRLETLLTANQYNYDLGSDVFRSHLPLIGSSIVPCIGFNVDDEVNLNLYARKQEMQLPVRVQGVAEFGVLLPPVAAEKIYADINECILSDQFTLGYDSGGTAEIVAGNIAAGEDSGAQGKIISLTLASGAWATGNAAGVLTMRRVKGEFLDNEEISIGAATGRATVDGTLSGQGPAALSTGGFADAVTLANGGVIMPESDGLTVSAFAVFNIRYLIISGNPYSQT